MTRDDAINAIAKANRASPYYCGLRGYEEDAAAFVDNLIAMGMFRPLELKASNEFASILARFFPGPEVDEVWKAMDEAGLEVVYKSAVS